MKKSTLLLGTLLSLSACIDERVIIYTERIAILPDASGYLAKDIRALSKTESELVIREVVGEASRELYTAPLKDFTDAKFTFTLAGDTIRLFHTQPKLPSALRAAPDRPSFPVRIEPASPSELAWRTSGTAEGDAIFYAPDKWKAFLALQKAP